MYYKASLKALENKRQYHMAAILRRKGRVIKIGENTDKTHPRFKRQHSDGTWSSHMHAEMNVLRFAAPGDEIEVMRVEKYSKNLTMAKPCTLCELEMKKAGISRVRYTDWNGDWVTMKL